MVLPLKRWKSRASPGIKAGALRGKTHSQVKGLSHIGKALFRVSVAYAEEYAEIRGVKQPAGRFGFTKPAKQTLPGCRAQLVHGDAGWSSPVARQAHNLKVAGSNPAPATNILKLHILLRLPPSGRPFCVQRKPNQPCRQRHNPNRAGSVAYRSPCQADFGKALGGHGAWIDVIGPSGLDWPASLSDVLVFSEQAFDENELLDGPSDRFDCHFRCVAEGNRPIVTAPYVS